MTDPFEPWYYTCACGCKYYDEWKWSQHGHNVAIGYRISLWTP